MTADGVATPVSKEQAGLHANMRRGQLPQSPEYAGKAVIRRVAGKEAVSFPRFILKLDAFTKQAPDKHGENLNSRPVLLAAAIERFSGDWLDPTKTVAELEQQGGRVLLELIINPELPPPPPRCGKRLCLSN